MIHSIFIEPKQNPIKIKGDELKQFDYEDIEINTIVYLFIVKYELRMVLIRSEMILGQNYYYYNRWRY